MTRSKCYEASMFKNGSNCVCEKGTFSQIRSHILKQFGNKVILKDIETVHTKVKIQAKVGSDEAQVTTN